LKVSNDMNYQQKSDGYLIRTAYLARYEASYWSGVIASILAMPLRRDKEIRRQAIIHESQSARRRYEHA
jgi:hypothetical protein